MLSCLTFSNTRENIHHVHGVIFVLHVDLSEGIRLGSQEKIWGGELLVQLEKTIFHIEHHHHSWPVRLFRETSFTLSRYGWVRITTMQSTYFIFFISYFIQLCKYELHIFWEIGVLSRTVYRCLCLLATDRPHFLFQLSVGFPFASTWSPFSTWLSTRPSYSTFLRKRSS